MPSAIVDHKIPEIEKCLNEVKTANKEGDIERLEMSVKKLDDAVYKLWVAIFWKRKQAKEQHKKCG
jgi:hypothetical protein